MQIFHIQIGRDQSSRKKHGNEQNPCYYFPERQISPRQGIGRQTANQQMKYGAADSPGYRNKRRAHYFIILKTVLISTQSPDLREKINMHVGDILRSGKGSDNHIPEWN